MLLVQTLVNQGRCCHQLFVLIVPCYQLNCCRCSVNGFAAVYVAVSTMTATLSMSTYMNEVDQA